MQEKGQVEGRGKNSAGVEERGDFYLCSLSPPDTRSLYSILGTVHPNFEAKKTRKTGN